MTFAVPGAKQHWPKRAACWSPATPLTGTPASAGTPTAAASTVPNRPQEGRTSGRAAGSTPKRPQSSSVQRRPSTSKSIVREALVTSVANTPRPGPPVNRHSTHESTVARASREAGTRPARPPSSSIQANLVAEKYGSSTRPVRARTAGRWPAWRSSSQRPAVRRSCHTMAGPSGPPARSQATAVSRWLVMPSAATDDPGPESRPQTSARVARTASKISSGSCSTQPGRGKCWVSSR